MHPDLASSEKTVPFWLPTNNRPPEMVGCDHAEVASGNPSAHLSLRSGTISGVSPANGAGWNRLLVIEPPQLVHWLKPYILTRSLNANFVVHRPVAAPATSPESFLPLRNSATARRSIPLMREPWGRMDPRVSAARMASGERSASVSRLGARESGAPLWQVAHSRRKMAEPSGSAAHRATEIPNRNQRIYFCPPLPVFALSGWRMIFCTRQLFMSATYRVFSDGQARP
jgi:hypothetical protein